MKRKAIGLVAILGFLLLGSAQANDTESSSQPKEIVETLHESLIELMKSPNERDFEARFNQIEPIVLNSFDFELIGRIVLGRAWRKLDDEQKQLFKSNFARLSAATYVSQFNSYSNEKFELIGEEKIKKKRVVVKTQFISDEKSISFNYILYSKDQNWRIINLIVDGVSDLSLKRSDYTAILKSDGFDGLISKLQTKTENLFK